jgi:hypothetical protein
MLIEHLEVDLLACQFSGNLTQMQRGAGEPVQARDHEGVAFPGSVARSAGDPLQTA